MAVTVYAYNADNTTKNGNRRAELTYSQTKGTSSQNYSTINWTLTIAGTSGGNWYDTGPIEAWIGSTRVYHLSERKSWSYGKFPVATGSTSSSFQLNHNNDGSVAAQTVTLKAAIFTGTVHESSTTWTLESIARYFSSTPTLNLDEKTETSLKYSWTTSETCSQYTIYYKKSSDSTWKTENKTSVNATSGTFTLSNLSANTLYHVYIKATRSDSGLVSDSDTQKPTTYQWPYIKSVGSNPLTIGNNQTIKIYNPRGHSITFKIDAADGTNLYTKTWNPGTGEDLSYTITDLNTTNFYNEIPSATSSTASYYCYYSTISNKVATVTATYQIKGTEKPVITKDNFTFKDSNTVVTEITNQGKGGWLVQSLSTLQLSLASKGALTNNNNGYIKSYDATFAGIKKSLSATSSTNTGTFEAWGTFNNSGTHKITITATDTRGLVSDPITIDVTFVEYYYPTVTLSGSRENNYGTTINLSMAYSYSTVNGKNSLTKQYRRSDSTSYTTTTSTANPISITQTASNENSYTYDALVTDTFGKTAKSSVTIPRGLPIMFVDSSVLGVGVNTFPTVSGLDVNGPIKTSGYISALNGQKTLNAPGWYRIAKIGQGAFILNLHTTYWYHNNSSFIIGINATYRNGRFTELSGLENTADVISQIRMVRDNDSNNYIDIYYTPSLQNNVYFEFLTFGANGGITVYNFTAPPTSGETAVTTYTLTGKNAVQLGGESVSKLAAYPVGAIYLSTSSTSPSSLFGGSWEQIKDVFLLTCGNTYSNGATGGSATVALTESQLPAHTHPIPALTGTAANAGGHDHRLSGDHDAGKGTYGWSIHDATSGAQSYVGYTNWVSDHTHSVTTNASTSGSTGSTSAHNNMPPYLAVYAWKRTA